MVRIWERELHKYTEIGYNKFFNMVKLTFNMKMRGTHSETHSDLSKKLWDYLLLNRITFIIVFLPGALNQVTISRSNQWHTWVNANWIPAGINLLKVNNRNTRKRCEKCSKRNNKGTRTDTWRRSGAFIVYFEHISHLVLFLYLTLNM